MKVLITLGPTREYIDPVRFISNESSGKMGAAIAKEALKRKHEIKIIHGKTCISIPDMFPDIPHYEITTTEEIKNKVIEEVKDCDLFICAAAISDFTFEKRQTKIKSDKETILKLKPTMKITKLVKESFPWVFVVGFKAEYNVSPDELCASARKKIFSENLDMVVANDVMKTPFGSNETEMFIITKKEISHINKCSKERASSIIFDFIEKSYCNNSDNKSDKSDNKYSSCNNCGP